MKHILKVFMITAIFAATCTMQAQTNQIKTTYIDLKILVSMLDVFTDGELSYVVGADGDKFVRIRPVNEIDVRGKLRINGVTSLVMLPFNKNDGHVVVTGLEEGAIEFWSVAKKKSKRTLHHGATAITQLKFIDNNRLISGGQDGTIVVWDLATNEKHAFVGSQKGSVTALLYIFKDEKTEVVVSGSHDDEITIWDLKSGKLIHTLAGHTDSVSGLVVTEDKKYIISSSWDETIKKWDIETGLEVASCVPDEGRGINALANLSGGEILYASSCNFGVYNPETGLAKTTYNTGIEIAPFGMTLYGDNVYAYNFQATNVAIFNIEEFLNFKTTE